MNLRSARQLSPAVAVLCVFGVSGPAVAQQVAAGPAARDETDTFTKLEEVTVVGIRESVEEAQELKRRAPVNLEAITVQDLGKFSDSSVSDAIQRIPGVQIQRNDDAQSGDRASIRGLSSQYITTTVNGREALSYGDYGANLRSFNLDSVPSEILTGVTVYKTSSAELVEPGLAGAIDMTTLRPLEYRQRAGSPNYYGGLDVRGDYDDLRKKASPRLSGFFGGKFADDTLGAYVAFTVANTKRRQDENEAWNVTRDVRLVDAPGGRVRTIPGAAVPDEWNLRVEELDRKRHTFTTGLQFKPSSEWNINADFTYNRYDIQGPSFSTRIIPGEAGVYNGIFQPGGITFDSHNNVTGLDSSKVIYDNPNPSIYDLAEPNVLLTQDVQRNDSKTTSGGINIAWHHDDWKVIGDISGSKVEATLVDTDFYTYSLPLQMVFDGSNASKPRYSLDPSFLDQSQYRCIYSAGFGTVTPGPSPACFFTVQNQFFGDREAFKLDFSRSLGAFALKFGGRYQLTHTDNRAAQDFSEVSPADFAALRSSLFTGQTRDTYPGVGIVRVPLLSTSAACAASPGLAAICGKTALNAGSFAGPFPATTVNPADTLDSINFGSFNNVEEKNLGLYVQLDGSGDLFGIPFDANVGLRGVHIEELAKGFSGQTQVDNPADGKILNFAFVPVTGSNSYWQYLPSLNLALHPRDNVNLRFGVAKVMSLPQFEDMAVTNAVTYAVDAQAQPGTYASGNIGIKPITSVNYDLTGEYYTGYGGAYIVSLFYKDAKNFILTDTANSVPLPGFTPAFPSTTSLYNTATPTNFSNGYADGFELGTNQPFRFLSSPWDGLGFQANYTYVYSKFDKEDPRATYGFPGTSKTNVNSILYYEKYGFGVRLAYNYRSDFFNSFGTGNGYRTAYPAFTRGSSSVDASLSYELSAHLELTLSGQNLTGAGRYDYNLYPSFLRAEWTRPRVYSVGVRGTF